MIRLDLVTLIIREEDDTVVGFGISLPSLSHAMQKAKGHLFPFGWIHLLKALKTKPKVIDLYLTGVLPEYQNKGVNALLFNDLIPVYIGLGVEYAEIIRNWQATMPYRPNGTISNVNITKQEEHLSKN